MEEKHNIENFFKNRLDSQNFVFNEEDWQVLENRMNEAGLSASPSGTGLSAGKLAIILFVALSVAFLMGWILRGKIFNPDQRSHGTEQIDHVLPADPDPRPLASTPLPANSLLTAKDQADEPGNENIPATSSGSDNGIRPAETSAKENSLSGSTQPGESGHGSVQIATVDLPPENIPDASIIVQGERLPPYPDEPFATEYQTHKKKYPISILPLKRPVLTGRSHVTGPAPYVPYELKDPRQEQFYRWSVGPTAGPEFNSVGFSKKRSYSFLTGARLWYHITPNWSVQSGLLYSHKKYETDATAYTPPKGYWIERTNGRLPDRIDGSCRVLDIPLNFAWQTTGRSRMSFVFSGGLSTYFLLDEYYDFEFDTENQGAATGWQTTDNSMVNWSIVNASVGVNYKIGTRLSLMAESVLKIPVGEVGWGNVELHSAGVFISARYHFNLIKNQ